MSLRIVVMGPSGCGKSTVGGVLAVDDRIVVACSALRRVYRDAIRTESPDTFFAELIADRAVLEARMRARVDHFMPTALLNSQLATLEPLDGDEHGTRVELADVDGSVSSIRVAVGGPAA